MQPDKAMVAKLVYWISERQSIYVKKTQGLPKPWTDDPVLRKYRFCNVYREQDTVTRWIADNWRAKYADHPNGWFAMVLARLLNWPWTLSKFSAPLPWKRDQFVGVVRMIQAAGGKAYSSAYIVSTNGNAMNKAVYLADRVLEPLWQARETIRPKSKDTCRRLHQRLARHTGMGSFIAGQVVADTKFMMDNPGDFWTFAVSGPGSKRGLNRVCGRPIGAPWNEQVWYDHLEQLGEQLLAYEEIAKLPRISMQDLQNCLCEFDKYRRVELGAGTPRSKYPGV